MARRLTQLVAVTTAAFIATVGLDAVAANAIAVTQLGASAFTHPTLPNSWVKPAGSNVACLTANASTSITPVPGCGFSTPDADGSGALRLTSNTAGAVGTVFYTLSLPTSQGLDINFNSYQYKGSGADGIAFMLAAADPTNPSAPATTGPSGGSLGYSASGSNNGLPNGYLGLGVDVYGNYTNTTFSGSGCATPSNLTANTLYPQQLTARGPGNGTTGYCILSSTAQSGGLGSGIRLDSLGATSRAGLAVPVEVAINPSGSAITTNSGLSVAAGNYVIAATPLGGAQKVLTGPLPTTLNNSVMASTFPSAWINPTTHIPYQLTLGWAASTGGSNEIHEIDSLASSTVSGQLPVFTISGSAGNLPAGGTADFTLTPGLSASEGSESSPVSVTSTFPAGVTPGNATGNGWACTTTGQNVSCTATPSSALAAGSSLPNITVPTSIASGTSGSQTVAVKVSSVDGLPASNQITASVVQAPSAPGAPTAVTGSVTGTTANVTWTPPASDGGSPITSYMVVATPVGGGAPVTIVVNAPATSATLSGLKANTSYNFSVAANNAAGASGTGTAASPGTTQGQGYWTVGADGGVFAFGDAQFFGSATELKLAAPVVAMAPTPDRNGYWLVAADGGVFAYGDAQFYGSDAGGKMKAPVAGIAAAPDGAGYWLVAKNGSVDAFGSAVTYGDASTLALNGAITGITSTPSGHGYWLAGADGGVFGYGDATFHGNALGLKLNGPITAISASPTGSGYYLTARDGGVFGYGDSTFRGNALDLKLKGPIVGVATTPNGSGYYLVGDDGGVFAYGSAVFQGSMAGKSIKKPMTFIATM